MYKYNIIGKKQTSKLNRRRKKNDNFLDNFFVFVSKKAIAVVAKYIN